MHTVLIVDDETRDRNIVKILMERRYAGAFRFLEAENGTQALEILETIPVQLLVLDMNMPGMSGIDMLHHAKYTPYVIVLTAHDNFEYTREALRCGVRDYLLKPPLREEFYKAVDHFLEDCERIQESLIPQIQSREVFTRDLARQMMYYGDQKKMQGLMDVLDITGSDALCCILNYGPAQSRDSSDILDEVEELLDRWKAAYAAAMSGSGLALFLFCSSGAEQPLQLVNRLIQHLENGFCTNIRVQTGGVIPVAGGYPKAFLDLMRMEQTDRQEFFSSMQQTRLENAVRHRNFAAAMEVLQPALDALDRAGEQEDLLKHQLLIAMNQCTRQLLSGETVNEGFRKISGIISAQNREQVTEIAAKYIGWIISKYRGTDRLRYNAVQEVVRQVEKDCSKAWSIDQLADSFHINAGYLSHLFKEQMGRCFTDYLSEQRISQAVELMRTTNLSLAQIGEQVGYSDPNYFSRVFKKKMGIGPREFSKKVK